MPPTDKDKKRKHQRLVDVEVTHVSLVDRPANRTPFKFVKRDEDNTTKGAFPMHIGLKNMFGSRGAAVSAVMADTEAKAREVAKTIMVDGTIEISEQDGVFVARKQGVEPAKDEQIIHLGKTMNVAYAVTNLKKELVLYGMESEDFSETVQKEGFVPGLYTATEALHTTIRNIAMSEDTNSPEAFKTKVDKALSDFAGYVDSLVSALPTQAFKFEKALVVVSPNDAGGPRPALPDGFSDALYDSIFGEPAADAAAPKAADEPETGKEAPEAPAEAAPKVEDPPKEDDTPKAADATPAPAEDAPKVDAAPANMEELPKNTDTAPMADPAAVMQAAMDALTKSLGTQLSDALKPLSERLDANDANMAKLSKAIGSSVASTPEADEDSGNVVELAKSNPSTGEPPLLDTAYRASKRG